MSLTHTQKLAEELRFTTYLYIAP